MWRWKSSLFLCILEVSCGYQHLLEVIRRLPVLHVLDKLVLSLFSGNWFAVILIFVCNTWDNSTFTSSTVHNLLSIPFNTWAKPKLFPVAQLLFGLLARVMTVPHPTITIYNIYNILAYNIHKTYIQRFPFQPIITLIPK